MDDIYKISNIKLLKCVRCKRSLSNESEIYKTLNTLNSYYICKQCFSNMEDKNGFQVIKK